MDLDGLRSVEDVTEAAVMHRLHLLLDCSHEYMNNPLILLILHPYEILNYASPSILHWLSTSVEWRVHSQLAPLVLKSQVLFT